MPILLSSHKLNNDHLPSGSFASPQVIGSFNSVSNGRVNATARLIGECFMSCFDASVIDFPVTRVSWTNYGHVSVKLQRSLPIFGLHSLFCRLDFITWSSIRSVCLVLRAWIIYFWRDTTLPLFPASNIACHFDCWRETGYRYIDPERVSLWRFRAFVRGHGTCIFWSHLFTNTL